MTTPMLHVRIANYFSLRHQIQNFQELHRGAFSTYIKEVLEEFRDYAEEITHVDSGTLAGSHIVYYDSRHQRGYVTISPDAVKPTRYPGRAREASIYGYYEHRRGGSHAFYERALREFGNAVVMRGVAAYLGRMPGGVHQ